MRKASIKILQGQTCLATSIDSCWIKLIATFQNKASASASWDDFGGLDDDWGDTADSWRADGKSRTRKQVLDSQHGLETFPKPSKEVGQAYLVENSSGGISLM